ncbi:unnamed protein product [Tilletia controversa]|nr:unnamed protein product [Tilletia controversa]CAD6933802.1 unnamed protein product [Tilletia controversa]
MLPARDRTGSSTYSAAEGSGELLHLPAPPSTEAGASSSPPPKNNNKNRRRRKARTGATTPAGSAEHGVVEDGTGSRVTSSSEDSDDQDGRSSKRSNNSGSAAIRRRTARKNGRAAAAGGAGGQAGASATPSGQGSRLQLRGDGITVLRPTTSSSSSAAANNNKQPASEESTEEGKLARRPPSASTRLISAILRKLFTLEPDVLDAFLLGSETHHQNVRTSGRDSNASGGARSVSNSSTTASSRPRRTVRFAELGGGASGEAENVRPYEYEYRTFAAAYQQQQRKSSSRSRSSEGKTGLGSASETVSSNPILAIARAAERAEAGENEDEEDGDGDEADEVGLVKIDPEGKLATRRPRTTKTGNADGSSGGAFEHPYKQTRRSSSAGEHDENDEANTSSASFQPVRRNASSTSLTSSTRPRTTYSDSSSAIVGGGAGGGATMMEPTAWEAIRALFDERLARQAYSFHEGIGLPLSLRLLRWVLGRSGVWDGGAGGANKGRRGTRAAVVAGIGWDGIEEMLDGDEEEDEEEGQTEDGLFSSEVGDFARLVGGEAALFGGDVAAAATETGGGPSSVGESEAVKRERERREWERAWARGVALASAAAHASASTEPSEVGEDARHGSLSPPLGYHARSYSAYDLSHYPPQDGYYNPAAVNVGVGGDGAEYLNPPHVAGRSSWVGGGNRALAHFHHQQQQQQGGGTYPSHFASYGDLPAIAASIESSFGGPSFHEARQHHSPTSSAVSSSLPSPSALELGLGTAGLGGAVQFRPTVGGPTVAAARGGLGLLESDDGGDADEEGSTGRRYSRRVVG